jgi:hypothetical protein
MCGVVEDVVARQASLLGSTSTWEGLRSLWIRPRPWSWPTAPDSATDSNPLRDVRAFAAVRYTIRDGKIIARRKSEE